MTFSIIYEDNEIIVINKPCGIISHDSISNPKNIGYLVHNYLKAKGVIKPYIGIVHRIDQAVSGALIVAKTHQAAASLSKQFADRTTEKTYHAIVKTCPEPKSGEIIHYLIHSPQKNKATAFTTKVSLSKTCTLSYQVLGSTTSFFLLEVKPKEGRTHQIRSQLAAINSPIKGDLKYGFDRSNKEGGICLHAYSISFIHPSSHEKMQITAPYPVNSSWDMIISNLKKSSDI